jgi:hypothetical protein
MEIKIFLVLKRNPDEISISESHISWTKVLLLDDVKTIIFNEQEIFIFSIFKIDWL